MINVSTIMAQLQEWLQDDIALDGFIVERSEFVNEDPGVLLMVGLEYTGAALTMTHVTLECRQITIMAQ